MRDAGTGLWAPDQVCAVKNRSTGYWLVLSCVFTDLDFVSVHKNTLENLANLDLTQWQPTGNF